MNKLAAGIALAVVAASPLAGTQPSTPLPDPTRPLSYAPAREAGPELVLQAIMQRSSGPEAIVSGQRVRVGSSIDGARIESIGSTAIVYSYGGQRRTIELRPNIQKQN